MSSPSRVYYYGDPEEDRLFKTPKKKPPKNQVTPKKAPLYIAYTNFHTNYRAVDFIRDVIAKLGGARLQFQVDCKTTHLVCKSEDRTKKIIRAATRGCFVTSFEWIEQSNLKNGWIYVCNDYKNLNFMNPDLNCLPQVSYIAHDNLIVILIRNLYS